MAVNLLTEVAGLRAAFKVLKAAILTKEIRFYLSGVAFGKKGDEVTFTAIDGHKLITVDVNENEYFPVKDFNAADDFEFIIPREAIEEFIAPDKIKCMFVNILIDGDKVRFIFDNGEVEKVYKLVDGTFPDWRRVLPKNTKPFISFNPKYLEQFCKTVARNDLVTMECESSEKREGETDEEKFKREANAPKLIKTSKGAKLVIVPCRI